MALGGGVGAGLRYLMTVALPLDPIAVGTVSVNVLGAFLLGLTVRRAATLRSRLFWQTGVLGSFTTFGAVMVDSVRLGTPLGTVYLLGTVAAGLGAALLGLRQGLGPEPAGS